MPFVEEVNRHLKIGKVALGAEIDKESVIPVNDALTAVGGKVLRRTCTEVAEAQFEQNIDALEVDNAALESEASQPIGAAQTRLHKGVAAVNFKLDEAMQDPKQRVDMLRHEGDAKAESLKAQRKHDRDDMRGKIEERVKFVQNSYPTRSTKLSQA